VGDEGQSKPGEHHRARLRRAADAILRVESFTADAPTVAAATTAIAAAITTVVSSAAIAFSATAAIASSATVASATSAREAASPERWGANCEGTTSTATAL
jgi:hypothetical protein